MNRFASEIDRQHWHGYVVALLGQGHEPSKAIEWAEGLFLEESLRKTWLCTSFLSKTSCVNKSGETVASQLKFASPDDGKTHDWYCLHCIEEHDHLRHADGAETFAESLCRRHKEPVMGEEEEADDE